MRLHSPQFERALRRGIKQTLKSSPRLQREFRRSKAARRQYSGLIVARPLMSFALAAALQDAVSQTHHPEAALALLSLWSFGFIFVHAQRLVTVLFTSPDLAALVNLPIEESTVFRWQLQKFWRGSLWSLGDLVVGYLVVAVTAHFSWQGIAVSAPLAVVAWFEILALSLLGLTRLPRLWMQRMAGYAMLVFFAFAAALIYFHRWVLAFVVPIAPALNALLPTGWPGEILGVFDPDHAWIGFGFAVPVAGLLLTLKSSLTRLAEGYRFMEAARPEMSDMLPGQQEEVTPVIPGQESRPQRVGLSEIEEIIATRQFFAQPVGLVDGPLERYLWNWFGEREKMLAEFVWPNSFRLVRPWKLIFRTLLIACVTSMAVGAFRPDAEHWILGCGLTMTLLQVIGQARDTGRAYYGVRSGAVNIPFHAVYPVTYRELGRMLLKSWAVQLPMLIAYSFIVGVVVTLALGQSASSGAAYGMKGAGLLFLSRYLFLTFGFSGGTNDSITRGWKRVVLVAIVVFMSAAFLILGVGSIFIQAQPIAWACCVGAGVDVYLLYRIYGWFYQANWFDLMNVTRV